MELLRLLSSEFKKNKRSKTAFLSCILVVLYLSFTIFYTIEAVGMFDNFIYLYKFALGYMNYLILPMILLSFITTTFSNEYRNGTLKNLWTIPVSRKKLFWAKSTYILCIAFAFMGLVFIIITVAGYLGRFQTGMSLYLVLRFFVLCMVSSILVTLAVLPVSIISILTRGNSVATNLTGTIYNIFILFNEGIARD